MTTITGNTYPVRDQLKALGGKWDPVAKGWVVSDEVADQARALVNGTVGKSAPQTKRPRYAKCHECGAPSKGYYRCYQCSLDYRDGGGMHAGGQSYRDSHGRFVLGDDD